MKNVTAPLLSLAVALALAALSPEDCSATANKKSATSQPAAQFVGMNGVRLHYLDWGGRGEPLLFLTGLGGTAEDFQALAVRLIDRFHVYGLTRRGQGQSEKPVSGYDTATLVNDIKSFLDQQKIERVTLVGYSLAGNEMTAFATGYPQRIEKLVYLDAAYDLQENAELGRKAQLNLPPLPGADEATLELIARANEYHPDYTRIAAPALGFFVTYDQAPKSSAWDDATKAKLSAYWNHYGKAYRREQIDIFKRDMKNGCVVELHNTTHASFIFERKQQNILIRTMRSFLLTGE